ncbi:prenyltransferase/squalene oxidase repeat-containing protein [Hymenobacter saemangeumensis]|uniref:prenyltransferase/squalene oxidase repeat-containing protein n=1 Tax=Hymenobacter saemangeumensis TaxID=1084522 RepID=UPI0031EE3AAD
MEATAPLLTIWKNKFIAYVGKMALNNFFKHLVTDEHFISKALPAYLYYPLLFNEAFQYHEPEKLEKLCLAGFFYYRSLIELDDIVDSTHPTKRPYAPLVSSICQEEAIKLLSSLFPLDSIFWCYWGNRRDEYLNAVAQDKANPITIPLPAYETHAEQKSAFGKIAIDSLHVLTEEKYLSVYEQLLKAHRHFSVGFQLLDDVKDYRKDAENAQINWAHMALNEHASRQQYELNNWPLAKRHSYLHLSGVANKLLKQSNTCFSQALEIAQALGLHAWQETIVRQNKAIMYLRLYYEAHVKRAISKSRFSTTLRYATAKGAPYAANELACCLRLAETFITDSQNEDGSWQDFHTNAGLSNSWVTGYVLAHIADIPSCSGQAKIKAARFLQNSHQKGSGWGYNTDWIADVDSTTTALLALDLSCQPMYPQATSWVANQRKDGGFSTYTDHQKLYQSLDKSKSNLTGWLQNHTCVSAMAYYFLARTNDYPESQSEVRKFLLHARNPEGMWGAYWWTSPIYSTTYIIKGLLLESVPGAYADVINSAVEALLNLQLADGGFGTALPAPVASSAYYTGLVLDTICSDAELFARYRPQADKACNWLLRHQHTDGSWSSSALMQIPSPEVQQPQKEVSTWRLSSSGTNIIVEDEMRVFSTVIAMKAISAYRRSLPG